MAAFTALACALLSAFAVYASESPVLAGRQTITALTAAQIASYTPFTYFASAGYCQPSATLAWNCGANCDANPGFRPVASGGDGDSVQFWFVGFDPSLNTVIVSHQGTDPSELEAVLTDIDVPMRTLSSTLFPGLSSSIEAESGFADEQEKAATAILAAVEQAMSAYGATHVTLVGHSLGAALTLIDSVFLPLHLPTGTSFETIGYGMPRVGNEAFADYVDAHVTSLSRVNNKEDPIPIVPGRFLGYHHPSGEVHIEDSGEWASCSGQDNTNVQCSTGDVPTVFDGDLGDHDGPYNGITMGC